jgi:hypothetical protein
MKLVRVLEYGDVYGRRITWPDVTQALSTLDPFIVFGLASHWNALIQGPRGEHVHAEDVRIVRGISTPEQWDAVVAAAQRIEADPALVKPISIVHRQQLLILMAETLKKSGDWNPRSTRSIPGPVLLDVLLGINEHLTPPRAPGDASELFAELLALADLSQRRNVEAGVTRILRMLREVADEFSTKPDIPSLFRRGAGTTVETYLSLAFGVLAVTDRTLGLKEGGSAPLYGEVGLTNIFLRRLCGDSSVPNDEAQRFLDGLSAAAETLGHSLQRIRSPQLDFSPFRISPMVALGNAPTGEFIYRLVDRTIALEKICDGPFWTTHAQARKETVDIRSVNGEWGRLFEGYGHQLVENTPGHAPNYDRNPAFTDGRKGSPKEDADGLLVEGHAWIVLEFKFSPLPVAARAGVSSQQAEREIVGKYGEPKGAAQLARLVKNLLKGRPLARKGALTPETTVYPVLVAWDSIMSAPGVNALLQGIFQARLIIRDARIKPLTVLSIEDFEAMLAARERASLVTMLSRWHERDPDMRSSPAWIFEEEFPGWGPQDHPWIHSRAQRWKEEMVLHLWPNGATAKRLKEARAQGQQTSE